MSQSHYPPKPTDIYTYFPNPPEYQPQLQKRPSPWLEYTPNLDPSDPYKKLKPDAPDPTAHSQQKNLKIASKIQNQHTLISNTSTSPISFTAEPTNSTTTQPQNKDQPNPEKAVDPSAVQSINDKQIIILDEDSENDDDDECMIIGESKPSKASRPSEQFEDFVMTHFIPQSKLMHAQNMDKLRENFFRGLKMREMAQSMPMPANNNIFTNDPYRLTNNLLYSNPYLLNSMSQLGMQFPKKQAQQQPVFPPIQPYMSNNSHNNPFGAAYANLPQRQLLQPQASISQYKPCVPIITLDENDEAETNLPEWSNNSTIVGTSMNEEISSDTGEAQRSNNASNALYLASIANMKRAGSDKPIVRKRGRPPKALGINNQRMQEKEKKEKVVVTSGLFRSRGRAKKLVHMIGDEYQAKLPVFSLNKMNSLNSSVNRRRVVKVVWDPDMIGKEELDKFFGDLEKITRKEITDQEVALKVLRNYNMNAQQALSVVRRNKISYRDYFEMKSKSRKEVSK